MLRETVWRVWICWILMSFGPQWGGQSAGAHSCHEVKTAFQLRQIGPLKWVPETATTDAELQICKHQGPTCCTRKMEESYHAAARRDTLQNILSHSLELKYLFTGHAAAVQDTFHSLLSFTFNHTLSLLDLAYEPIAYESRPLVSAFFSDLALYLCGNDDISLVRSVRNFFDQLFPLVYRHLVNPGLASSTWSAEGAECLSATRQDLNPFGPHPQALAHGLGRVLGVGRSLMQALRVGVEVLNISESSGMSKECGRAIVRMQFCSHCKGLTLIRPCQGLCLNVMRGCLAGLAELQGPWSRYIALLEGTSAALAGGHELELTLLGIRERINDAILNAQLNGPHLSATVEKVCGALTESTVSTQKDPTQQSPTPQTSAGLDQSLIVESVSSIPTLSPIVKEKSDDHRDNHAWKRSLPLKPSKHDKPRSLKKISLEFMNYIQRYKSFFCMLPEVLCDSEMVLDEYTCWNGEDVVESYTGFVVGNGFQAQRQNPEIKIRSVDPVLVEAKETLERFNQDMWAEIGLDNEQHMDSGSGTETSGECDDEDGCEGSGEDEVQIGHDAPSFLPPSLKKGSGACRPDSSSFMLFLSLFPLLLSLLYST